MSDLEKDALKEKETAWTAPLAEPKPKEAASGEHWERDVLNRLLFAAVNEQRRARRWGIFFKSLFFGYLLILLGLFVADNRGTAPISAAKHTALVELQGVIADGGEANADQVIAGLRAAYEDSRTAGIILRINSPGGSPVQAGHINDEIARLRQEHPEVPLYAVITDVCASGGYYVAVAAEKIYADKASIVGSIGVVMDGFGFVEAMNKLGVERRLLTAGDHKGLLDPFSPLRDGELQHVRGLLKSVHQQFIDVVKQGRGERLKGEDGELFSGLVWTGEQGLALGLIDGLGNSSYVARELIGAPDIVDFTQQPDFFQRLAGQMGMSMAKALTAFASGPQQLR